MFRDIVEREDLADDEKAKLEKVGQRNDAIEDQLRQDLPVFANHVFDDNSEAFKAWAESAKRKNGCTTARKP